MGIVEGITRGNPSQRLRSHLLVYMGRAALEGAARHGAPSFHDFDIKAVSDHIEERSAAGPAAFNDGMPQDSPFPTSMELYELGEGTPAEFRTRRRLRVQRAHLP